jgi:hypothetical protein
MRRLLPAIFLLGCGQGSGALYLGTGQTWIDGQLDHTWSADDYIAIEGGKATLTGACNTGPISGSATTDNATVAILWSRRVPCALDQEPLFELYSGVATIVDGSLRQTLTGGFADSSGAWHTVELVYESRETNRTSP